MMQISSRPPRKRRRLAVPLLLGALALGAGAYVWRESRALAVPPPAANAARNAPVRVGVALVEKRDVPVVLNGLGTVQASQTVNIHTRVDGTLQGVNFSEGQNVKAGDVLATLDPRLAQAALDQARAARAKDEAQLKGAESDLARYSQLVQKDYASRQSLDQQQATVDGLKASIVADEAAIETAQTNLDYMRITAPFDGRMGIRQVDAGNIVHSGDATPISVLAALKPISVVFSLPERDLASVQQAALRGPVPAIATGDDGAVLGTGTLSVLDNQIDAATATLKLKATFANTDERLWPGAFVHVNLAVDTVKDALTVSPAAIQRGPDGLFAWVVGADGRASVRPVETGQMGGGVAVVTRGLDAGDTVVIDGQYRLRSDAKVVVADTKPGAGQPGSAGPGAAKAEHLAEGDSGKVTP